MCLHFYCGKIHIAKNDFMIFITLVCVCVCVYKSEDRLKELVLLPCGSEGWNSRGQASAFLS